MIIVVVIKIKLLWINKLDFLIIFEKYGMVGFLFN